MIFFFLVFCSELIVLCAIMYLFYFVFHFFINKENLKIIYELYVFINDKNIYQMKKNRGPAHSSIPWAILLIILCLYMDTV